MDACGMVPLVNESISILDAFSSQYLSDMFGGTLPFLNHFANGIHPGEQKLPASFR